jgi:NADPH-dependent curcumin reductase CurA
MFSYLPAAKLSAQLVAGLGISKIVSDVIRNQVVVVTRFDAIKVWAGSLVISSMIVEQSSNHIERCTDEMVTWFKNRKAEAEVEIVNGDKLD